MNYILWACLGLEMGKQFLSSGCAHKGKRLWSDLLSQQCFSTIHEPTMNIFYSSFPVTEVLFCYEDLDRHSYLSYPCSHECLLVCSWTLLVFLFFKDGTRFNQLPETAMLNSLPCCQVPFLLLLTTSCSSLCNILLLLPIVPCHSDTFKDFCNLPLFPKCIRTLCLIFK